MAGTLHLVELLDKLKGLHKGVLSPKEITDWATDQYLLSAMGELELEPDHEEFISDMLILLMSQEDESFRLSNEELTQIIIQIEARIAQKQEQ